MTKTLSAVVVFALLSPRRFSRTVSAGREAIMVWHDITGQFSTASGLMVQITFAEQMTSRTNASTPTRISSAI
jgi:hypothetical protein